MGTNAIKTRPETALDLCKREHPDHWGLYYNNSCDECWASFHAAVSREADYSCAGEALVGDARRDHHQ